jgi:hypothetical protein
MVQKFAKVTVPALKRDVPPSNDVFSDQLDSSSQSNFSVPTAKGQRDILSGTKKTLFRRSSDRAELDDHDTSDCEDDPLNPEERQMWSRLLEKGVDKYEAASIIQPRQDRSSAAPRET